MKVKKKCCRRDWVQRASNEPGRSRWWTGSAERWTSSLPWVVLSNVIIMWVILNSGTVQSVVQGSLCTWSTLRTNPRTGRSEDHTACPTTICMAAMELHQRPGKTQIGTGGNIQHPLRPLAPSAGAPTRARTPSVGLDPPDAKPAGKGAVPMCLEEPRVRCASVRDFHKRLLRVLRW